MKNKCVISECDDYTYRYNGKRCRTHLTACIEPGCTTPTIKSDGVNSGVHCQLHWARARRGQPMEPDRRWTLGGRYYKNADGYMVKKVLRQGKFILIREHREIMAELLDRPLLPNENVHHKNGVRSDNHPDNLELWVSTQPSGQRVTDLVKWAREIESLYGKDVNDGIIS